MTQALYAHMNKKKKEFTHISKTTHPVTSIHSLYVVCIYVFFLWGAGGAGSQTQGPEHAG
jgi:hypothetical protein